MKGYVFISIFWFCYELLLPKKDMIHKGVPQIFTDTGDDSHKQERSTPMLWSDISQKDMTHT